MHSGARPVLVFQRTKFISVKQVLGEVSGRIVSLDHNAVLQTALPSNRYAARVWSSPLTLVWFSLAALPLSEHLLQKVRAREAQADTGIPRNGGQARSHRTQGSAREHRIVVDADDLPCSRLRRCLSSVAAVKDEWLLAARCCHVDDKTRWIMRVPVGRAFRSTESAD